MPTINPPGAPPKSVNRMFGRRIGFLGDSIFNGSSAANSNQALANQTLEQVGSAAVAKIGAGSVLSGHPGFRSDQIAPFLGSDIIGGNCDVLVTLQGTNDTGQGVSVGTYAANMLAQFKQAKQAGLALVVLTIPPRGSNASPTAAQLSAIDQYNTWLRLVVPQYGTLVDIHKALFNNSNGFLNAIYDSGDGIHPNSLGHWLIAQLTAAAIKTAVARPLLLNGLSTFNIVTNPYFLTGTAGWFEQPGGTGTVPVYTRPADTTAFLSSGNWLEMDFDGTALGGSRTYATAITTAAWSIGDTLAVTGKVQLVDVSGNWQTVGPGAAGTASVGLKVTNQGGATVSGSPLPQTGLGYPIGSSTYNFGPYFETFVVPAGTTSMNLWFTLGLPTGSHFKMHLGEIGVLNLTTSGFVSAALSA